MKPQNKQPSFTLLEAVKTWLDGDFKFGDEAKMIADIRKDLRITLSDDEIIEAILDAMDEGLDAQTCLERLAKRN
ncbi:MAG: hypothetical protein ACXWTS_09735 [Methylococcaceae bacterium]